MKIVICNCISSFFKGERCIYFMSNAGDIQMMKKLEYNPSSFLVYENAGIFFFFKYLLFLLLD